MIMILILVEIYKNLVQIVIYNLKNVTLFNKKRIYYFIFLVFIIFLLLYFYQYKKKKTIKLKNKFTEELINGEDIKAVVIENNIERPLEIVDSRIQLPKNDSAKIVIKSLYYKDKTIVVCEEEETLEIVLQPDDAAMKLKHFMTAEIQDWRIRKEQIDMLLADELEVKVLFKADLGAEYYTKQEFTDMLLFSNSTLKKMKVLDLKYNSAEKINFIGILQE